MAAKKNGFNLASLDTISACNKPIEVQINDIHGNPTPFFISVLGKDSDVYRNLVDDLAEEEIRRRATGKPKPPAIKDAELQNIGALVAVTTGWRVGDDPVVELGDEKLEFSPANVRKVYQRLLPVREQVGRAVIDVERFMQG